MFYLFYNPLEIPHAVTMPQECPPTLGQNEVGARVVSKSSLDSALQSFNSGYSPKYQDLLKGLNGTDLETETKAGWRLEDFVSELMLKCKVGLIDDSSHYESLKILMNQKSRPMSCALSLTFDANE